jgi:hypothetical protein
MYRGETKDMEKKADRITLMEVEMRLKKCSRKSQKREKT